MISKLPNDVMRIISSFTPIEDWALYATLCGIAPIPSSACTYWSENRCSTQECNLYRGIWEEFVKQRPLPKHPFVDIVSGYYGSGAIDEEEVNDFLARKERNGLRKDECVEFFVARTNTRTHACTIILLINLVHENNQYFYRNMGWKFVIGPNWEFLEEDDLPRDMRYTAANIRKGYPGRYTDLALIPFDHPDGDYVYSYREIDDLRLVSEAEYYGFDDEGIDQRIGDWIEIRSEFAIESGQPSYRRVMDMFNLPVKEQTKDGYGVVLKKFKLTNGPHRSATRVLSDKRVKACAEDQQD